jgi:hypothetical protein
VLAREQLAKKNTKVRTCAVRHCGAHVELQLQSGRTCKDLHMICDCLLAVQLETAAREAKSLQHALAAREQVCLFAYAH